MSHIVTSVTSGHRLHTPCPPHAPHLKRKPHHPKRAANGPCPAFQHTVIPARRRSQKEQREQRTTMGPINISIRGNGTRRTGAPPIPAFLNVDGMFRRKTSAARANEDATAETPPPEQLPRFVNLVSFIFLHSTHGTTVPSSPG